MKNFRKKSEINLYRCLGRHSCRNSERTFDEIPGKTFTEIRRKLCKNIAKISGTFGNCFKKIWRILKEAASELPLWNLGANPLKPLDEIWSGTTEDIQKETLGIVLAKSLDKIQEQYLGKSWEYSRMNLRENSRKILKQTSMDVSEGKLGKTWKNFGKIPGKAFVEIPGQILE